MDCPVMQEVTVSTVGTAAEVIGKVAETTTVIVGGMGVMSKKGGGKGLVASGRGIEDMEGSDGILLAGMCKVVPLTAIPAAVVALVEVVVVVKVVALLAFLTVLPLLVMAANPPLTLVLAAIRLEMAFFQLSIEM